MKERKPKMHELDLGEVRKLWASGEGMMQNPIGRSDIWKGCCNSCSRATSIAGVIGDDGLCNYCRRKGYKPINKRGVKYD